MGKNIYLARQSGTAFFKIGITKNSPELRIEQLQTGNANILELVETFVTKHDYRMETALHAHFRLKRVNLEWFELDEEDVALFVSICERNEHNLDLLRNSNSLWM